MPEATNIRLVTAADRENLGRLWLAFLQEQSKLDARVVVSDDALERWQNDFAAWIARDSRHILVAEQHGDVVGFTAAVRTAPAPIFAYVPELFIEELFVRPDARRRGVGTALYRAIAEWG
ncbi:MAG TPA: GNAT family N-acetyltransferase, partial [Rhodothermales bacterium]